MASFSKFIRPSHVRPGLITDRDLDIIDAVLRYRFAPASELVRLVGGNEDVTNRRLRRLWEAGLISRWAFPGIRRHSEFHYYLDSRQGLDLLAEHRGLTIAAEMLDEIKSNREKDYAQAAFRGQHMQLGFLRHALMISRVHFMLEVACRRSAGAAKLEVWCQGGQLAGGKVEVSRVRSSRQGKEYFWQETEATDRLPVEPDAMFTLRLRDRTDGQQPAHFFYEADRGSMVMTDMLKKLRAYYHLIKKQQRHRELFGVHPIRAVLFETTDEARGKKLMELANHPLVCGPGKRAGLFWFTISPLFTNMSPAAESLSSGLHLPGYLEQPEIILDRIWALPDRSLHSLGDAENSGVASGLEALHASH